MPSYQSFGAQTHPVVHRAQTQSFGAQTHPFVHRAQTQSFGAQTHPGVHRAQTFSAQTFDAYRGMPLDSLGRRPLAQDRIISATG